MGNKRVQRVQNAVLGCNLKNDRMISVCLQGKPQLSKSMPQPVTLKKLKLNGFMKTYNPFRTNTPKRCRFHYRGLECKSRKSRNSWSNTEIWPWNAEWNRAKTNRVLPRKCTGQSKYPLPTTQEKTLHMDITRGSTLKSDWLYWGFPGGSEVKASVSNVGDLGLIPGSGRSPGEGHGNLLQYSCLENPVDRGAW